MVPSHNRYIFYKYTNEQILVWELFWSKSYSYPLIKTKRKGGAGGD